MEEIAHTIGRAFIDNHSVRPIQDTRTGRAHHILRLFAVSSFPQADLGKVNERVITTTAGVRRLGRTDGDCCVALRHKLCQRGTLDTYKFILLLGIHIADFVEHRDGVFLNHLLEHALNLTGTFIVIGYNKGVEACAVDKLHPCHVEL